MLRVIVCDPSRDFVRQVSTTLRARIASRNLDAAVVRVALSPKEVEAYLRQNGGVHYAVMSLMFRDTARRIRNGNRESYLVFSMERTDRLLDAFEGLLRPSGLHIKPVTDQEIADLFESAYADYLHLDNQEETFSVSFGAHAHRIRHDHILYFEAAEKKLFLVTKAQRIAFYGTLDGLMQTVPTSRFLRVHKGFIVNRERMREVDWSGMRILVSDRDWVPISRTYRQAVREVVSGWELGGKAALVADIGGGMIQGDEPR